MKNNKWSYLLAGVVVLGAGGFLGWRVWESRPSDMFKAPLVRVPDFSFKDRSGREVTRESLEGKVWVADFIFTHCAGICPVLSNEMKKLQDAWEGNDRLNLVSYTVDPERDTPKRLGEYADQLGAEEGRWFFLSGKKKDLYEFIQKGFLLTAEDDPQGGPGFEFIHTSRMVLVDPKGMIRGFYDGQKEEDLVKLRRDVKFLMGKH